MPKKDSKPGLSALDGIDYVFAHYLAEVSTADQDKKVLIEGFQVPTAIAILTIDPAVIFDIRNSETGAAYFESVEACQQNPDSGNRNNLLEKLGKYVSQIDRTYLEHGRSLVNWGYYLRAIVPTGCSRELVDAAATIVTDTAGLVIPYPGSISLIGKLAAITFTLAPESLRRSLGPLLQIGMRIDIDIEEHAARLRTQSRSNSLSIVPEPECADASFK